MANISYYPILKWKKGEQYALKELSIGESRFIPVIEIVEEIAPEAFFADLRECFNGPIYIDTIKCDESRTILYDLIEYANDRDIDAWPLLYPDDIYEFYNELAEKVAYLAIKMPIPDDFDGIPNDAIIKYIVEHKNGCKVDLFLDAGEILSNKEANRAFAFYKTQLDKINIHYRLFNNIVICLTSFPEKLDVEAGETATYKRYDIKIFDRLNEIYADYNLAYSDYGVTKFTETELDFSMMKYGILPKIKYTTKDYYVVLKGEKDRRRGIYIRSTIDMTKEIINSDYYSGKDFSYGDAVIYEKATKSNSGPGGNQQWVTYCANHHLAFVMKQLSNLGGI